MLDGRPVWRLLAGSPAAWRALDAATGALLPPLDPTAAAAAAEAFASRRAIATEELQRDQWTVPQGLDPWRPLVKVTLEGDDGLQLYVSRGGAEVVRDTRRAERFWNWIGAVPHWIYPTALRQFPRAWNQTVVWLAIPAVLLAASGLVLGVWQLFLNRSRWIPYRRFWLRWHHILGLAAGLVTVTWIFSGLMSMNPFGVFSPRSPLPAERAFWQGAPAVATLPPGRALEAATAAGMPVRELEWLRFDGQAWYRLRDAGAQRLVRAQGDVAELRSGLPGSSVRTALAGLRAGDARIEWLAGYDDLYYSRDPAAAEARWDRPLPVWRAAWPDGVRVYADGASARILLRTDATGGWQRLLYNGLHSFDFAPLVSRPWLRTLLVVGLSVLGFGLCVTSGVIAWRVLLSAKRPIAR